ncbi:MAG: hypothetical protein PHT54_03680 [Candidatus Nanoarchaeia archaeon]|nr:hypothetical protein [Candidatus Nanoarchaeia archaeon]
MRKRGQVTLFVIMGLMIVVIVALFLILKGNIKGQTEIPEEFSKVNDFVQGCVEDVGSRSIGIVSLFGGYYPPKENIEGFTYFKEKYITLEEFEKSLSNYFNANLVGCVSFVEYGGYEITSNNVNSEFSIKDNSVELKVNYPYTLTKGGNSFEFNEEYEAEFDEKLKDMYDTGNDIYNEGKKQEFCISCIMFLMLEKDLKVEVSDLNNNTLFMIYDDKSKNGEENLIYVFAI